MDDLSTTKKCAKPWCKRRILLETSQRHCDYCRQHDKVNQQANRARKKVQAAQAKEVVNIGRKHDRNEGSDPEERPATRPRTSLPQNAQTHSRTITRNVDDRDDEEDRKQTIIVTLKITSRVIPIYLQRSVFIW